MNTRKNAAALFILRIGLGVFLLLWSIDKLVVTIEQLWESKPGTEKHAVLGIPFEALIPAA